MKKIAFFDNKPYDREFFDRANKEYGYDIRYFKTHLNENTAELTEGIDAVCAFVNDDLNGHVIDHVKEHGIGLIALRSAGYKNVDLKRAYKRIHTLCTSLVILRIPLPNMGSR